MTVAPQSRVIGGWVLVSRELVVRRDPVLGPPLPWRLALLRALGGRPAGPYRRAP